MPHVLLTLAVDRLMVTLGFVVRRFVFGASVVPWQLPFISPFAGYYMTPTSMTLMPCSCLLRGNNRSVMPLDVLGSTRATLMRLTSLRPCPEGLGNLFEAHRDGDRLLQVFIFSKEFPVSASHQLVLITSLPFVHTARHSYRLSDPANQFGLQ